VKQQRAALEAETAAHQRSIAPSGPTIVMPFGLALMVKGASLGVDDHRDASGNGSGNSARSLYGWSALGNIPTR